jgi:CheY-like chemotaxis protein
VSAASRCAVLVVDDDSAIREVVRDALTLDGYRVTTAADGAAALIALRHVAPCVVLLDMRMPNVDGWEFSRLYRAGDGDPAPIVVMTAAEDARRWCAEIGGDACLSKPFDLAELYGLVAGYCGRAP